MQNDQIIRQKRERNALITGIAMTVVLHACALVLVSFTGLKYIYPPPQEQSMLIDFTEVEEPAVQELTGQEPTAEEIDLERYLETGLIEHVVCGGESGPKIIVLFF